MMGFVRKVQQRENFAVQESEEGADVDAENKRYEELLRAKVGNDAFTSVSAQTADNMMVLRKQKEVQTDNAATAESAAQWETDTAPEAAPEDEDALIGAAMMPQPTMAAGNPALANAVSPCSCSRTVCPRLCTFRVSVGIHAEIAIQRLESSHAGGRAVRERARQHAELWRRWARHTGHDERDGERTHVRGRGRGSAAHAGGHHVGRQQRRAGRGAAGALAHSSCCHQDKPSCMLQYH